MCHRKIIKTEHINVNHVVARSPNPGGYFLYDTTVLRQATHTCEKEIKSNVNGDVVDPEDVHAVMWRNKRSASMLHSQENIVITMT